MQERNKIALWAAGVVVVLAVLGIWYYRLHEREAANEALEGTSPIATETVASGTPAGAGSGGVASAVGTPSMPYAQAVNVYAKTRIQFDANCRMTPEHPVFKNGVTVMFDNRYRDARSFRLDGARYTLPGYGYKLLKLTAHQMPHVIDVDCGTGQNTGKITLE